MLVGSPGPFNDDESLPFAKEVYANFDLVTNRESVSHDVLLHHGFDLSKTIDSACPAFLYNPAPTDIKQYVPVDFFDNKLKVGMVLCGWNMLQGPFNREDWTDEEFSVYVEALSQFVCKNNAHLYLMSHANGFMKNPFKMIHGRDYPFAERLYLLLRRTESIHPYIHILDTIAPPNITKQIIRQFDMFISGRVHGAVAALSQAIPTVMIDYGHEPKAHKVLGFAQVAQQDYYLVSPNNGKLLTSKIQECWDNRENIHQALHHRIPQVQNMVHEGFDKLKTI